MATSEAEEDSSDIHSVDDELLTLIDEVDAESDSEEPTANT